MSLRALFRVELGRLLCGRLTWLAVAATLLGPLAGYGLYRPAYGDSMASLYLANPMLTGGLIGAAAFALLMLASLEKPRRSRIAAITDAALSPLRLAAVRLFSVLAMAVLTVLATGLLYLPYTWYKLDIVFSLGDYWLATALLLLSGPVMGTLLAAAVDQFAYRLDISLAVVLACIVFSQGAWCSRFFLAQWCVPLVTALSDAFGSAVIWRTALYSRIVWLCLLTSLYLLSLLGVRQYGRGLIGSFARHLRFAALPLLAATLAAGGGILWARQPFIDHSPSDWMSYQPEDRSNTALTLAGTEIEARIESYLLGTLSGTASYRITNTSGESQELYFELDSGYRVREVTANGNPVEWEDMCNDYIAAREVRCVLPAEEQITLVVEYGGMPKMWNAQEELMSSAGFISGKGIELFGSHLAPSLLLQLAGEETPVTLDIALRDSMTLVSSGTTRRGAPNGDGTTNWHAEDAGAGELRIFAGDYMCRTLEGGGFPIEFWYSAKYEPRLAGEGIDIMQEAIDYCTEHYGPRTFTQDKPFKIVQSTVFQFGGSASGNISQMGESYFSDQNLASPDKGADSAEVLAHEIIHQWWGLGVSLADMEDANWTDEGMTTYSTYRLMAELKGEEYARANYVEKWERTTSQNAQSFYMRHPEYLAILPEAYAAEVKAAADSVNWYAGTALMIYRAEQKIGRERLDAVLARLYTQGGGELPPYITLGDFLNACDLEEGEIGRA